MTNMVLSHSGSVVGPFLHLHAHPYVIMEVDKIEQTDSMFNQL